MTIVFPTDQLQAPSFLCNRTLTAALARIAAQFAVSPLGTMEVIAAHQPRDTEDDFQPLPPTEDEMNEHFLLVHDWQKRGEKWYDAVMDIAVPLPYALAMQDARDFREALPTTESD